MGEGWYDVAVVCRSGHVATSMSRSHPEGVRPFCDRCGQPTLNACESCSTPIRGLYHSPGVIGFFDYSPPAFCAHCGAQMPWTTEGLAAAETLAQQVKSLSRRERRQLQELLPDLVRESPQSTVAAARFRLLMDKAGPAAADGFREILYGVATEGIKRAIWG